MELTMLTRFCMSQNIRDTVQNLPQELEAVKDSFIETFESDGRGTLPNEIGSHFDRVATFRNTTKYTRLSDELYGLLCNRNPNDVPSQRALMQTSFEYRRATFSAKDHSKDNSYVIIGSYPDAEWCAAQITEIIVQPRQGAILEDSFDLVVVLKMFSMVNEHDASHDFYLAQNRHIGVGSLFYKKAQPQKQLANIQDIVCHFSCNPLPKIPGISRDCIHVLPLYRVSTL
jgi:hypothetical protein